MTNDINPGSQKEKQNFFSYREIIVSASNGSQTALKNVRDKCENPKKNTSNLSVFFNQKATALRAFCINTPSAAKRNRHLSIAMWAYHRFHNFLPTEQTFYVKYSSLSAKRLPQNGEQLQNKLQQIIKSIFSKRLE